MLRLHCTGHLVCLLSLCYAVVHAEEKKDQPVIKVIVPLGIPRETTTTVLFRGVKLGEITEIKFPDLKTAPVVAIKSKGAASNIDKLPADKIGDSQVQVEVTLPVDAPVGLTPVVLSGPQGQSDPRKIMILDPADVIQEKEPNDGFSEAQEISFGKTVVGLLAPGQNNDVYRFQGEAGKKVRIAIQANSLGSPLDPFVLLHNGDGQLLAEVDDNVPESRDPVVEMVLPKTGPYFISVLDSHDLASPLRAYLLKVESQ